MSSALSIHDLHRSFRAGIPGCSASVKALSGIDLEVSEGEIVAIAGHAGAGKSTLLQCAAGQLRPDRGTVRWFGRKDDIVGRPPGVVYVPEKAVYYSSLTVREALEYYATITDVACSRRSTQVSEALRRCALLSETDRRVRSLTESQLRRLGIAQALLASPRLLLIDGGIGDNHHRSEALRLMEELTMQGVAIVIATRDMARVRSLAARAFTLASGKLTEVSLATHAVERSLELSVSSPIPDYERLSTRIHGVIRRGDRLHIPLGHHSPEEILSHCRTLGIAVNHSRVVAAHHWV